MTIYLTVCRGRTLYFNYSSLPDFPIILMFTFSFRLYLCWLFCLNVQYYVRITTVSLSSPLILSLSITVLLHQTPISPVDSFTPVRSPASLQTLSLPRILPGCPFDFYLGLSFANLQFSY